MNSLWCYSILNWTLQSIPLPFLNHPLLHLSTPCPRIKQQVVLLLPKCITLLKLANNRDRFPAELWQLAQNDPSFPNPLTSSEKGTWLLEQNLLQLCQGWLSVWPLLPCLSLQRINDVIFVTLTFKCVVLVDPQHYQMLSLASWYVIQSNLRKTRKNS